MDNYSYKNLNEELEYQWSEAEVETFDYWLDQLAISPELKLPKTSLAMYAMMKEGYEDGTRFNKFLKFYHKSNFLKFFQERIENFLDEYATEEQKHNWLKKQEQEKQRVQKTFGIPSDFM